MSTQKNHSLRPKLWHTTATDREECWTAQHVGAQATPSGVKVERRRRILHPFISLASVLNISHLQLFLEIYFFLLAYTLSLLISIFLQFFSSFSQGHFSFHVFVLPIFSIWLFFDLSSTFSHFPTLCLHHLKT